MPNGQYPAILAGTDYTAGLIQSLAPIWAYKAADSPPATTTTLAADPDLTFPVAANAVYLVFGWVHATGAAIGTGDLKLTLSCPGAATAWWDGIGYSTASTTVALSAAKASGSSSSFGVNGSANPSSVRLEMYLSTGSASTLTLQWAENTTNATGTVLKAGSRLLAVRAQ